MFPTSGLFQEFLCPLFSDGQCDRPYCHFNHSKPQVTSMTDSESSSSMEVTPVYKPTPIKLLEKLEVKNSSDNEKNENSSIKHVTAPPSIPVYQPTPISELEKYAPSALSAYGLPNGTGKSCFAAPATPPTYSPVVRPKQTAAVVARPDPTASVEFLYQPSPAYPPITEKDPYKKKCLAEFSGSSDDDDGPASIHSSSSDSTKTDVTSEKFVLKAESSPPTESVKPRIKKLKRKMLIDEVKSKSQDLSSTMSEHTEKPSNEYSRTTEVIHKSEESDCAAALKRQKLLSLYHDLYGDEPEAADQVDKSQTSSKKTTKTIRSPIAPYQGELPAKLPKKQSSNIEASASLLRSNEPPMPRPIAPLRKSDKIPMPIRTRYLDQFIEECLVIYQFPNDAYERALTDEQACHDKATSRMAYLNAVIQRLKSLKAEKAEAEKEGIKKQGSGGVVRASRVKTEASQSKNQSNLDDSSEKKLDDIVRGPLFYDQLRPYLLDEDALVANGFPREDKTPGCPRGRAVLRIPEDKRALYSSCQENERICSRCGTRFTVDEFGNAITSQKCVYHWSRPVKLRTPGIGFDLRYPCCQGEIGQPGCQICPTGHVHEANKWLDNEGFVTTLPPLPPSLNRVSGTDPEAGGDHEDGSDNIPVNIYAVDCEMVYTTAGCELARCTIVDSRLRTVLDCIIQPDHMVLDCNTRFSGLKIEEIEAATMRITDVQAKLLHLLDSDSILIGHSLESDLAAMKLIHSKVVDTSVVFPHRLGPPKKRALRNLVGDYLQRIIQQGECGHNSLEDASACMELMQYKVKEDLRRGKWAFK